MSHRLARRAAPNDIKVLALARLSRSGGACGTAGACATGGAVALAGGSGWRVVFDLDAQGVREDGGQGDRV